MKTVAIISEYNPFHYGHLYQIRAVREELGENTRIIAIMSGNFTQRGELAIVDKTIRARAAVDAGCDLVLELPFPYSSSSAEFFAKAGVYIADSIGVVDHLSFGSESGDLSLLFSTAKTMLSDKYQEFLDSYKNDPKYSELGYPRLCELAYRRICDTEETLDFTPNNILALEYIKALIQFKSNITPITVKRHCSDYNSVVITDGHIQSASAIREIMYRDSSAALEYIPEGAKETYKAFFENGYEPISQDALDLPIISFLRLNSPDDITDIQDANGGLYNRLHNLSFEANDIPTLIKVAETKRYTNSRIRRVLLNSYFGVTSSDVRIPPAFAQVLAMNPCGCAILKEIKRKSDFPIITKPSAYTDMGECVIRQKRLSNKADSIYALCQNKAVSGRFPLTFTPYVKKG